MFGLFYWSVIEQLVWLGKRKGFNFYMFANSIAFKTIILRVLIKSGRKTITAKNIQIKENSSKFVMRDLSTTDNQEKTLFYWTLVAAFNTKLEVCFN